MLNNNIEKNEQNSEIKENTIFFDEKEYYSWLSEIDEENARQKDDDNLKVENLKNKLQNENNISLDSRKKEEFERIKKLILEIAWIEKIPVRNLDILIELTEDKLEIIKKNKDLIMEITWLKKIPVSSLKELSKLTEEEYEMIIKNKDLILEIAWKVKILVSDLKERSGLSREELEKFNMDKDLILGITWERLLSLWDFRTLSGLTKEKLEKIKTICYRLWIDIPVSSSTWDWIFDSEARGRLFAKKGYWEDLCQIDEKSIDYCNSRNIKELWMIIMVDKIMKNSSKVRDYIKRKQEYLKNNELIDDSEFKRLFWWDWKYWKWEINQKWLWYCYLYTAYEILKKMNYFEVLIKTSLKESESWDWRYVKLPMWQLDWDWIYVSKNDIDKKFDIPRERWLKEYTSINSDSPLWFKIMEIAYIKKELMDRDDDIYKEFLKTGDIILTWERLHYLEWYNTVFALSTLIWDNNIINRNAREIKDRYVDIVFDNFQKWLIVNLSVKKRWNGSKEVKLSRYWGVSSQILEKNMKIISKDKTILGIESAFIQNDDNMYELRKKDERGKEMLEDVIDVDGEKHAIFYKSHAYSLARCYVDKSSWEKRVWIVNPRHTWIKFDISFESAKKIFDWTVSYIDIDKLFR